MESEQRSQALKSWLKSGGLITATSSLGTGVDYPQIVRVLHVGVPYGMIDFAQESGRAGRGGELVDSVILVEEPRQAMPPVLEPVDQQWRTLDTGAMHQFIHAGPGACRRNILSMYLDGQSAMCAQIQAANCDVCGEGAPEWADALKKEAQEEAQIRQALNELVDGCPICWVMGNANWSNHIHAQCPWCAAPEHKPYSLDVCEAVREQKLRWTTTTHTCYKCGLSQQFCATRQGMAEKCQWPGIMIPILVVVLLQGKPLLERLDYQGGDMEETLRWFAQKHGRRKWGAVVNNAMVVLGAVLTQPHARNVLFS
jgi:superfamily II DNA helicase RecQ